MTKTLQDLIDESIFISTEYQARLAELTGDSDWSVDFSAPSFTLQSDPSVALTPYLLGTESEQRGSWIWSWQELGHFPDEVVAAAVQSREAGESLGVQELSTDELLLSDGLARRLTLAAKTVTGIYAHYPATAGGGVRAWLLLDGPQFELPEPTVNRMGRVMAQALQTDTAVHHQRAVDSYARLRGAHIAWDTEACAIITAADGALRLWFDEQKITGIEAAEPVVDARELRRAAEDAADHQERLRDERRRALRIADQESAEQRRLREDEEARRVAETEAALRAEETSDRDSEFAASSAAGAGTTTSDPAARPEGVVPAETGGSSAPFDQDPRQDAEPGLVSTHVVDEDLTRRSDDRDRNEQAAAPARNEEQYAENRTGEPRREETSEPITEATPVVGSAEGQDVRREESAVGASDQPADAGQRSSEQPGAADQEDQNLSALERLRRANAAAEPEGRRATPAPSQHQGGAQDTEEIREDSGSHSADARPVEQDRDARETESERDGQKKGFFSRFFGL